MAQIRA